MIHRSLYAVAALAFVVSACAPQEAGQENVASEGSEPAAALVMPGESHIRNVRQLTFGGDNAEAYYSFDGTQLIYQHRATTEECDQIYVLDIATAESRMVSTGDGRTTCSYFYPTGDQIIYASTHHHDASCPSM